MLKEPNIVRVLNCPCTIANEKHYESIISDKLRERKNIIVVAINLRKIVLYNSNPEFKEIFTQSNVLPVPDGIGATIPMRLFNKTKTKKIDFPGFMFDFCNNNKIRCYFLGTTDSNNEKAVKEIRRAYPGIIISGRHSGFDIKERYLINDWLKNRTQVVFVAMGSPRQELLSARLAKKCPGVIFVGVGGRFDILAGAKKRAPKVFILLNLEWAYRYFSDPRRIIQQKKDLILYFSLISKKLFLKSD